MGRTTAWLGRTLLCTTAVLTAGSAQAQDVERYSISGSAVSVFNLAGAVRVERGSGDNVIVEVRRGGRDAQRLEVDRQEVDGRAALIVRYPEGDVVYRPAHGGESRTSLSVRSDGTFYGDRRGGDRVNIRSSGRGTEAHADLRVLVPTGRSVQVMLGVGSVVASNIEGDLTIDVGAAPIETNATRGRLYLDTGSGTVDVRNAQGDVHIDTGSGAVRAHQVVGDLLVDTGSGHVELTDVRGSRLHVDTGSGRVRAENVRADDVLVDTGSGSVTMAGVASRDVEIDTGSGGVELELLSDVDRLVVDTGSGSIRVAVPEDFGGEFEIEGSRVSVDVPATLRESDRDSARGTFGDGRGTIEIDTGSGRVSIVRR